MTPLENEADQSEAPIPVITAGELFQGDREVWLEYAGERYLLRITQSGKLLLTK